MEHLTMKVSRFNNAFDIVPKEEDLDWEEVFSWLTQIEKAQQGKKETPAFSFVEYGKTKLRKNKNIKSIHGLVIDLDNDRCPVPLMPEDISGQLEKVNVAYCYYSTYSSTVKHPKWRLVIPLSEPMEPAGYETAIKALSTWLGLTEATDFSRIDPAGLFYEPFTLYPNEAFAGGSVDGDTLSLSLLDAGQALDKPSDDNTLSLEQEKWFNSPPRFLDASTAAKMLAHINVCDYDYTSWLNIGMAIHYELEGSEIGLDLWDEWSMLDPRYEGRDDLEYRYAGFGDAQRPVTGAYIKKLATREGYRPPKRIETLQLVPFKEFYLPEQAPEPPEWLITGLAEEGQVGMLTGAPGVGKSFLLLEMAVALCQGSPFLGMPTRQCNVAFLNAEDDPRILHRRLQSRFSVFSANAKDVYDRLHYLYTGDLGFVLQFTTRDGAMKDKHVQRLIAELKSVKDKSSEPLMVIIDPLAAFNGGEENSNTDMSIFVNFMRLVCNQAGCTLIICHHDRKGLTGERDVGDEAGRGASAFYGGVRFGMRIRRTTPGELAEFGEVVMNQDEVNRGYGAIEFTKANYVAAKQPIAFRRGMGGVLVPLERVDVEERAAQMANQYEGLVNRLIAWLRDHPDSVVTSRDLQRSANLRDRVFGEAVGRDVIVETIAFGREVGLLATGAGPIRLA